MDYTNEELKKNIFTKIRAALPAGLKILYISLTGSRGKNMASAESDFDVRVIVQNTFESYILQRPKQTTLIKTELDGLELEGQAVDIIKAFEYGLETNAFLLDLLRGIPIFCESKELIDQLRIVFQQGFLSLTPLNAFQGLLSHYLSKSVLEKAKGKDRTQRKFLEQAPAKAIAECIFLILEIRCVIAEKDILNYFDIDKLLEFAGEDEQFMRPLIQLRRADRKQKVSVTEEFKELVNKTLTLLEEYREKFTEDQKEAVINKRISLRKEVDKACFELIYKSRETPVQFQ